MDSAICKKTKSLEKYLENVWTSSLLITITMMLKWWKQINYSKFVCCRTESKVWSPLVNEEGKTHPYKMNLASQPQVSNGISVCSVSTYSCLTLELFLTWSSKELSMYHSVGRIWDSTMPIPPRNHLAFSNRLHLLWSEASCWGELVGYVAKGKLLGLEVLSPAICMLTPTIGHRTCCRGVAQ